MFSEDFQASANGAKGKVTFLKKNPVGYFAASMLAGIFVGVGVILAFTIGGQLDGAAYSKTIMGVAFAVALSLVVMAGSELFTGNNFVMATGIAKKTITVGEAIKLWIVCYLGNFAGSILIAVLYHLSGLGAGNAVGAFMAAGALGKMSAPMSQLFFRGILCNFFVCTAVWCGFRCKTESGKLIMIFWCIWAFFTSGFEHSVANMTLLTEALLNPCDQAVSLAGMAHNLIPVTLGNMVGGAILLFGLYFLAQKNDQ